MKTIFDRLLKISSEYRETVDSLAQDHDLESRHDFQLRDEIKAQRAAERNARFNAEIDKAAKKAAEAATPEINKLRSAIRKYITSSDDAGALAAVQALVSAGVELSATELAAFSGKGGFAVRKLLEKHTSGKVKPLSVESLEGDLKELETFFRDITAYRSELGDINTARPWGQSGAVGSVIMQGQLDKFPEKLGEMAARWSAVLEK